MRSIKHRNDEFLAVVERELERCRSPKVRSVLCAISWLVGQMSTVRAYYTFFLDYLWMLHQLRVGRRNRTVARVAGNLLDSELDGAKNRLSKMFKRNLSSKWSYISLITIVCRSRVDARPYARFYRSFFPRSLAYFDRSYRYHMEGDDYSDMVEVLMEYCFLELARRANRRSRLCRLPESRFRECWKLIQRHDLRTLERAVDNDREQSELDYNVTHLVMSRFGYGCGVLAPASRFDGEITAYLARHKNRIFDDASDLDLLAEVVYCFQELRTQPRFVQKALRTILARQNRDGSWGTKEELSLGMSERTHGAWTCMSAVYHSLSRDET